MPAVDPAYRGEREALLSLLATALEADEQVVAVWLAGSLGRRAGDDLSDLDIWVVVDDDAIDGIAATPDSFVPAIVPTIMEIPAPQNALMAGVLCGSRRVNAPGVATEAPKSRALS